MINKFLVPLLFFCSGATALVYEVVWSKYLGQMMGSTIQAQTVVLAVFMGGLAVGNRLFGKIAGRTPNPLALYGYLELIIGLYGFFFPWIYEAADVVFSKIGTGLLDRPTQLLCLKAALSVSLLILPTVLMGGTLPLLVSWLQRQSSDHHRWSARFYSINSLGAVAGAGAAGFFVVRALGMVSSLQMTGILNVLIWIVALALSKMESSRFDVARKPKPAPLTVPPITASTSAHWFLSQRSGLVVAMTGGVSMGLEVLASRSLTLIFGASLHAFSVVLMAFILGIGIGGTVIASPRVRSWPKVPTILFLLLGASLVLSASVFYINEWVEVYRHLRSGIARSTMGYNYHLLLNTLISLAVLGLPAGLLGAVLPLFIRDSGDGNQDLAHKVGTLLTWNTLGAVVGVLITGFGLMPHLGLRASFAVMAALLATAASIIGFKSHSRNGAILAALALAAALGVMAKGNEDWRYVFSSGVFRNRETEVIGRAVDMRKQNVSILFYKDAPDATVSVEKNLRIKAGEIILRVNGKPDASSRGDLSTQYLLAHLPLLSKPDSKDVFILGFGSGITAGAAVTHPLRSLTIAENCAPVLEAGRYFEAYNRGVLTNSLTKIVGEDARTVLKLDAKKYDVIISEPSNPWMAGVGSVFSTEFYQLAASRLKEGGLMTQWFHIYEVSDGIVALVLRTFASVFPFFEIWDTQVGDIILVGSQKPWQNSAAGFESGFARPSVARDLAEIGLTTPQSLWVRQLASSRTAWAIPGPGPMQSDVFPLLEYEAPRAFYIGDKSEFLTRFDERTWMSPLAPQDKRASLSALSNQTLRPIFTEFGSLNADVVRYLNMRFRDQDSLADYSSVLNLRPIPSIFRANPQWKNALTKDEPTLKTNAPLAYAEKLIMGEPERWREAVEVLQQNLQNRSTAAQELASSLPPTHYAALGAITCLSHQELALARSLIEIGLAFDPSHITLRFLAQLSSQEALFGKSQ